MKFILPTAPTQPVTLNMGMAMPSWYDIIGKHTLPTEGVIYSGNTTSNYHPFFTWSSFYQLFNYSIIQSRWFRSYKHR